MQNQAKMDDVKLDGEIGEVNDDEIRKDNHESIRRNAKVI